MAQDPVDPVVALLLKSPLTTAQRRAASEAFTGAADEDDLQERMVAMNLPKQIRAELWDLKAQAPRQTPTPAGPEGSGMSRFLSSAGEALNPLTMAKGLWNTLPVPEALGGAGVVGGPMNLLRPQFEQGKKAIDAFQAGEMGEAAGRAGAALLPLVGPMAADVGEQIGEGDYAGAAGKVAANVAMLGVPKVLGSKAPNPVKADAVRRTAEATVAERVLAPANPKYKGAAAEVAPELLTRGLQGDRVALQQWADDLIGESATKIDAAWDALPVNHTTPTAPIIARLDAKLKAMEFPGKGKKSEVNPVLTDLHAELAALRDFVKRRGQALSKDDVRSLRQQFDEAAAKAGAFAKQSGDAKLSASAEAALDAANSFRQEIASSVPGLAPANAEMHLGLTVRDILDPTKGRPKTASVTTGATGGLHTTGAIIGSVASNIPAVKALAAFVASDLIPRIRNAQVSPANQLRLANDMHKLSESLASGKTSAAQKALLNMSMYVPGLSGQVGRLTTEPAIGTPQ